MDTGCSGEASALYPCTDTMHAGSRARLCQESSAAACQGLQRREESESLPTHKQFSVVLGVIVCPVKARAAAGRVGVLAAAAVPEPAPSSAEARVGGTILPPVGEAAARQPPGVPPAGWPPGKPGLSCCQSSAGLGRPATLQPARPPTHCMSPVRPATATSWCSGALLCRQNPMACAVGPRLVRHVHQALGLRDGSKSSTGVRRGNSTGVCASGQPRSPRAGPAPWPKNERTLPISPPVNIAL